MKCLMGAEKGGHIGNRIFILNQGRILNPSHTSMMESFLQKCFTAKTS